MVGMSLHRVQLDIRTGTLHIQGMIKPCPWPKAVDFDWRGVQARQCLHLDLPARCCSPCSPMLPELSVLPDAPGPGWAWKRAHATQAWHKGGP